MRRFTNLFFEIDATTRTNDKVAAMVRYFQEAPPADAAWALYFLSGQKVKRAVNTRLLREWVAAETQLADWLVDESYDAVGDLAETLAWLLPDRAASSDEPLAAIVERRVLPLAKLEPEAARELVTSTWRELSADERLVWHKLITGGFRLGVSRTLVVRALALAAGIEPAVMAHRMMGDWRPTAEDFARIVSRESHAADPGQPYPFFLAHALDASLDELGDVSDWQAEWKWDGIRAQLIRRQGQVLVWSRGEELITDRFPEVQEAGRLLADGTVLDGEVLCWRDEAPLPFAVLQKRIGRLRVDAKLRSQAPAIFMAYDLLEHRGLDVRHQRLTVRRALLEQLVAPLAGAATLRLSPLVEAATWTELAAERQRARLEQVEGIMLKRRDAPYGVGRTRGAWWKWKTDPYSIDAVLIYAQSGHGRRASLFTDYTFGLWHEGQLVPVAKAYSGLTDAEIREVDAFVRANTTERFGPVRVVRPELVFELHFESIQPSSRHRAGLAVRFPRMHRWRRDKRPDEADSLEALRLLAAHGKEHAPQ